MFNKITIVREKFCLYHGKIGRLYRKEPAEKYSCRDICEKGARYDVIWCCNGTTPYCANDYEICRGKHYTLHRLQNNAIRTTVTTPTIATTLSTSQSVEIIEKSQFTLTNSNSLQDITPTISSIATPTAVLTTVKSRQISTFLNYETSPKHAQYGRLDSMINNNNSTMLILLFSVTVVILAIVSGLAIAKGLHRILPTKKTKQETATFNAEVNCKRQIQFVPEMNIIDNDHCPLNAPPLPPQLVQKSFVDVEKYSNYLDAKSSASSCRKCQNVHYEIEPTDLSKLEEYGQGNYGKVLKGILNKNKCSTNDIVVAVKTTKSSNPLEEVCLKNELMIFSHIDKHCNIVNLIGAITKPCEMRNDGGNSSNELNSILEGNYLCFSALLMYALQIANGAYYYTHCKTVIHRDLALRNMLLTSEHVVKIADFGLAVKTSEYEVVNPKPSPSRWYAPESNKERNPMFTAKSDVWSYGVVLWELFSLAENVMNISAPTNRTEFLEWISLENRYEIPKYASQSIGELMKECWQFVPECRPDFLKCRNEIQNILFNYSDVYNYVSQMIGLEIL